MAMDDRNNRNKDDKDPKKNRWFILMLLAMGIMFFGSMLSRNMLNGTTSSIGYDELLKIMETKDIEKVVFNESYNKITVVVKTPNGMVQESYTTAIVDKEAALKIINEKNIPYEGTMISSYSLYSILYVVFLGFMLYSLFSMRKGGGMLGGLTKSNAKMYVQKETGVTFADVAGEEEAKESLVEVVEFLHDPSRFAMIGAKLPKGALLVGPPGTGKTMLAKAVAGEAKVPFFSLAGSDFVEMFVGMGASRVRNLFKEAQQMAPCIIFIDEIDAIGKTRDSRYGGNDEREQTLNALLSEMDGFDSSKGVFILAATNRPEVLDPALCRPGRLDRRIVVDRPDLKGRAAILKVHASKIKMDESVDLNEIALATSGAVGADLANMINEAAILAVKRGRQYVKQEDILAAVELVIVGKEKKDRIMNEKEKRMVSYHEVGHALASALQKEETPVQKITIVPHTNGALGFTMNTPEEERHLETKAEMEAQLVMLLAGRASEEIFFESVTGGAANDIERATQLARSMVTRMGMSEALGLPALESIENQYLDGRAYMNCSDRTAARVDDEVQRMLSEAYTRAKELISANKDAMNRIAAFLLEKETITGKEFMDLLHQVQAERLQLQEAALAKMEEAKRLQNLPEEPVFEAAPADGQPEEETAEDKE